MGGWGDGGSCNFLLPLVSGFFLVVPVISASEEFSEACVERPEDLPELCDPAFGCFFAPWEGVALFFAPGLAAIEKQKVFGINLS
jgi:hypothetical protein